MLRHLYSAFNTHSALRYKSGIKLGFGIFLEDPDVKTAGASESNHQLSDHWTTAEP